MFEILLSSKVPTEVEILNAKFVVSCSKQKLVRFDEEKSFALKYNFAGKNSVVYSANFYFANENLLSDNQNLKIINYDKNKFLVKILQKNAVFLQKKVKKLQIDDIFFNFFQNGLMEIEAQNEILFSEIYDFEILDIVIYIISAAHRSLLKYCYINITIIVMI